MPSKTTLPPAPILSAGALHLVHLVTQKCNRMLSDHENHMTSFVNEDKAKEITQTFAIEEFDLRMNDYVGHYEFSAKLVPSIIKATVSSILSAFPNNTNNSRSEIREDLTKTLQDYVRMRSDLKISSTRQRIAMTEANNASPLASVAEQLRRYSDMCRLTQEQMAAGIHVSPRSIARHLAGDSKPSKRHIAAYEEMFSKKLQKAVRLKTS